MLYPSWYYTKTMLHFQKKKKKKKETSRNVQTGLLLQNVYCQRKKGCLSSLFILVCLQWDVLSTGMFTKRDLDPGRALPCSSPRCAGWVGGGCRDGIFLVSSAP